MGTPHADPPTPLTARDLAREAKVRVNTIRYYQMLGLLASQRDPASGRRVFSPRAVQQVALILRLNRTGYTLRAIREIFAQRWQLEAAGGGQEPPAGRAGRGARRA